MSPGRTSTPWSDNTRSPDKAQIVTMARTSVLKKNSKDDEQT